MITVCPYCSKSFVIDAAMKNSRISCDICKEFFMAYEAERCPKCNNLKHPNHFCECGNGKEDFWFSSKEHPEIETLVSGLPDDVQSQLKKIFSAIEERFEDLEGNIEDLENNIFILEDEIENLRENHGIKK